jgi:hypothetical protein
MALLAAIALVITLAGTIQPAAARSAAPGSPAQAAGTAHTVSFDGYSFLIDGQRTYIWSGEFHYFRLPSPDLWLDIFQKMKAAGFNAASIYFDWGTTRRHRASTTSPAYATSTSCSTWRRRPAST